LKINYDIKGKGRTYMDKSIIEYEKASSFGKVSDSIRNLSKVESEKI
ncbi:hypothetical protein EV204_11647, partial [Tissierella praeacuta]